MVKVSKKVARAIQHNIRMFWYEVNVNKYVNDKLLEIMKIGLPNARQNKT